MIVKMQEVDNFCVSMTHDISKQDLVLIGYVGTLNNVIMRDVANYLDVPYSTATGIVDKLVQKDYLKRYNSETDRRTVLVCLTEGKGKATFEFFNSKKNEMSARIMSVLEPGEQTQLITLIEKVTDAFTSQELTTEP